MAKRDLSMVYTDQSVLPYIPESKMGRSVDYDNIQGNSMKSLTLPSFRGVSDDTSSLYSAAKMGYGDNQTPSKNVITNASGNDTNQVYAIDRAVLRIPEIDSLSQDYFLILTNKNVDYSKMAVRNTTLAKTVGHLSVNIVTWNFLQHSKEKLIDYSVDPDSVPTAEEIWKDWCVDGVLRNEYGDDKSGYNNANRRDGRIRLFNIHYAGETKVINQWGDNIKGGTKLFLILKKKRSDGKYVLTHTSDLTKMLPVTSDVKNPFDKYTSIPFQLIPYADYRYNYPPINEIKYKDEFGREAYGKVIEIGTSMYSSTNYNQTSGSYPNSYKDIITSSKNKTIDIILDPNS